MTACLGGSFFVDTSPADAGPGSGSTAAVTGTTYGYGIYNDSATTWANADGYLPALVTTFRSGGARVSITNFGDRVTIGGHAYVVIYSRVAVTNPTAQTLTIDPQPSPGLIPLAAQRSDGSLIVGRGVPDAWVTTGKVISLANFPTTGGHHLGLTVRTSGAAVTLTLTGQPASG